MGVGSDVETVSRAEYNVFVIGISLGGQGLQHGIKLNKIFGVADQQHFKQTIIHVDFVFLIMQDAANRGGIADGPENKIVFYGKGVCMKGQMEAAECGNVFYALQQISKMTQSIFQLLRCGIGGLGKCTEGSNIGKETSVKDPGIQCDGCALNNCVCGGQRIGGNMKAGSKIIGGTGRNVADWYFETVADFAGYDFIECAVAADTYDQVLVNAVLRYEVSSITAFACIQNTGQVICFLE